MTEIKLYDKLYPVYTIKLDLSNENLTYIDPNIKYFTNIKYHIIMIQIY
jgi:hypothetical protein